MEGARACLDLADNYSASILSLTVTARFLRQEPGVVADLSTKFPKRLYTCTETVFAQLSDSESPQGILAVVRQPRWDERNALSQARVLGIYGEQLRDPANVGAIIRTAAALNLTGLWLTPDSADWFSPKVVRATAGAILALPVFRTSDVSLFSESHCAVYAAVLPAPGAVSLRDLRAVPKRTVIALGNESRGLSSATLTASTCRFSIPLAREVESLNVAATAAIAAFHFGGLPTAE